MAGNVTIREYAELAVDDNGNVLQAGLEPAIATQFKLSDGTSDPFSVLNAKTRFVLISTDGAINWILDGTALTTANSGTGRLAADEKLFVGVRSGGLNAAGTRTPLAFSIITDA